MEKDASDLYMHGGCCMKLMRLRVLRPSHSSVLEHCAGVRQSSPGPQKGVKLSTSSDQTLITLRVYMPRIASRTAIGLIFSAAVDARRLMSSWPTAVIQKGHGRKSP